MAEGKVVPKPTLEQRRLDLVAFWRSLGLDDEGPFPATGTLTGNAAAATARALEAERRAVTLEGELLNLKVAVRRYLRNGQADRDLLEAMVE